MATMQAEKRSFTDNSIIITKHNKIDIDSIKW